MTSDVRLGRRLAVDDRENFVLCSKALDVPRLVREDPGIPPGFESIHFVPLDFHCMENVAHNAEMGLSQGGNIKAI